MKKFAGLILLFLALVFLPEQVFVNLGHACERVLTPLLPPTAQPLGPEWAWILSGPRLLGEFRRQWLQFPEEFSATIRTTFAAVAAQPWWVVVVLLIGFAGGRISGLWRVKNDPQK